jgi:hypothetical protein
MRHLDGAVMSCVNLSAVIQEAEQHDVHTESEAAIDVEPLVLR